MRWTAEEDQKLAWEWERLGMRSLEVVIRLAEVLRRYGVDADTRADCPECEGGWARHPEPSCACGGTMRARSGQTLLEALSDACVEECRP